MGLQVPYCIDTKIPEEKLYEKIRIDLSGEIRRLAECRESKIVEGHMMSDHMHIQIKIQPKHSVSQVVGYIKGKSAICFSRV